MTLSVTYRLADAGWVGGSFDVDANDIECIALDLTADATDEEIVYAIKERVCKYAGEYEPIVIHAVDAEIIAEVRAELRAIAESQ